MNKQINSVHLSLDPIDNLRLAKLCGEHSTNLRQIEDQLGVEIRNRGSDFQIKGNDTRVEQAQKVLAKLYDRTQQDEDISQRTLYQLIGGSDEQSSATPDRVIQTPRRTVRLNNHRQQLYVEQITNHDLVFAIGPAGTGKTYLAVASAVRALINDEVKRIILVRPAVEAGERLGFLPGDIGQKVDPYLRPLYDALYDLLGVEKVGRLLEKNIIELAPLAYMRGRTLNDSFVILDEAQNTTTQQMKMFLTRIGFGSKAVVTGDITQIDLPHGTVSGLRHAITVLTNVPEIKLIQFEARDVVRHSLVQKIVNAYAAAEKK